MSDNILEKNIQHYRNCMNLTQVELADRLHITSTYLGYIKQGKKLPSIELLADIANEYGIPLSDLFSENRQDLNVYSDNQLVRELEKLGDEDLQKILEILRANYESICL